ncbi:alpha/beta hydrolase [Pseudonocardiaceae bacterium YIM PH 21723]|nr:alpha/beta hydrolase [Pseudonocardiaceae bacterium YIM PH 21723]
MRVLGRATVGTAVAAVLLALAPMASSTPQATPVPRKYLDQQVDWKPCFPKLPEGLPAELNRMECGLLSVPQDWRRAGDSAGIQVAISRLPPKHVTKDAPVRSLFTNPGGPGGAGLVMPALFVVQNRQKLLDNYEILGIDVRGTGKSTRASCGGESFTGINLDPRDRAPAHLDLIMDSAALVAKFCQERSGAFGAVLNTEQTVRDLDLLRSVLGRQRISWLGYSAGTWLGAHYAAYFPGSVDRFVLDSNTEFTAPWQQGFDRQPMGFQRRFTEDFQAWAARYDAQLHLGADQAAVNKTYEDLRTALAKRSVKVSDSLTVNPAILDVLIPQNLYTADQFTKLAQILADLRAQSSDKPDPAAQQRLVANLAYFPGTQKDEENATFLSIQCNDTETKIPRKDLVAKSEAAGKNYPLMGWGMLSNPCAFWTRPSLDLKKPKGDGLPTVLMVQSEHDPATPIEGARAAHAAFTGSQMITVTGSGDHAVYASGNTCVDDLVEAYLVNGTQPGKDVDCAGNPLPAPGARAATRPAWSTLAELRTLLR